MMQFQVLDISCNHCAGQITNAVINVDPSAVVEVDVAAKLVRVDTTASEQVISDAIVQAGYSPVLQHE
jgi:copper chaperone